MYGTEGIADTDYMGDVSIRGKRLQGRADDQPLHHRGPSGTSKTSTTQSPAAITDNPTVVPSVRSNLTSILGRTAAYRGKEVTLWTRCSRSASNSNPTSEDARS